MKIGTAGQMAAFSFAVMWSCTNLIAQAAIAQPPAADSIGPETKIALGVFVVSIIATGGFVWGIAAVYWRIRHDHALSISRIKALEEQIKALTTQDNKAP